jgi:thiosulfate dehydrogenase
MTRLDALARLVLLGAAAWACSGEAETSHMGAAEQGRSVFSAVSPPDGLFACASCHAVAQAPGDERLLPGASLLGVTQRSSFWDGQENDLLRAVNDCRTSFQGAPPLARDDPDAATLYAFLESLTGPDDAVPFTVVNPVQDLPPGDATRGAALYDAACAYCHGQLGTGEGRLSEELPQLPDEVLAEHRSYSVRDRRVIFIEKVRHGGFLGYHGNMPPFSSQVLADAQLADLLSGLDLYPP